MTANSEIPRTGRIPADTFSNRLLLARKLAGMTIEEAAAAASVKKSSWANWENGRRPQGMIDVCQAIAAALDVDLQWLIFGGALAGPRGVPTKRAAEDNRRFPVVNVRPTDGRPPGRSSASPDRTTGPSPRRPVRISRPRAA